MPPEIAESILKSIRRSKDLLLTTPGFREDRKLKGIYVVLCTLEGAICNDHLEPLAEHCVDFVKAFSDHEILSN